MPMCGGAGRATTAAKDLAAVLGVNTNTGVASPSAIARRISPDGQRVDEVVFSSETGAILGDVTATKRYSPIVALSQLEGVRFHDDEAESARADLARPDVVLPRQRPPEGGTR